MQLPPPVTTSRLGILVLHVALLVITCRAQFPTGFTNLTTIKSPLDSTITISYKNPGNVCTTAFTTQEQYTGWVNIPGTFPTNLFFWYVGAREPTTQLTVWINGGPGSSSMFGLFTETGPCEVVELGKDRFGTTAREWGWDRASNMLFVDQPNQVGFSYDIPTNGSLNLVEQQYNIPPTGLPNATAPAGYLNGTFSSQNANFTANTTNIAALAVWHLMQGFLATFPQYNTSDTNDTFLGVNLFAESYGGKYGPLFAETWEEQNDLAAAKISSGSVMDIHLVSLGIMNGCVDDAIQGPSYVQMATNNTYGLSVLSPVYANLANSSFYAVGGCQDLINQCRIAEQSLDLGATGAIDSVNGKCSMATSICATQLIGPYSDSGRNVYDISMITPSFFPDSHYIEYLNTGAVQQSIGSVVNYTDTSNAVYQAFQNTGDMQRGMALEALVSLVRRGVRVALVYGDRDFICNWKGGEAISLALASRLGGAYATNFPVAGYAPIITNNSYIGGVVREYANLSFSRIYQAGHFVPAYQPETAFQAFARIIMGTSLSSGQVINLANYSTNGTSAAASSLSLPNSPQPTCFVRNQDLTCSQQEQEAIKASDGAIINGVWYSQSSDWPLYASTTSSASSGKSTATTTTSSQTLTGLFTATATPSISGAVGQLRPMGHELWTALTGLAPCVFMLL